MRSILVIALVLSAGVGCDRPTATSRPAAQRAFYYWRTTFTLSDVERDALAASRVRRLYVRMFDVDSRGEIVGPLTVPSGETLPPGIDIVPVVFLRQQLFRAPPADLADRIWREVRARAQRLGVSPSEIQLDCDWTESSRDAFFAFVRQVRAAASADVPGVKLSATIRLHQIKYRERTGVPPVDRGMLMFYSMGSFDVDPDTTTIFDPRRARRYLARLPSYPLPLDVALPAWSWTIHRRGPDVVGLMQNTDPDELSRLPFLHAVSSGRYRVTRTTFLHGELLREGDLLEPEVTGAAETTAAARLIAPHLAPASDRTVALFDLSERNLARHDVRSLDLVYRTVR